MAKKTGTKAAQKAQGKGATTGATQARKQEAPKGAKQERICDTAAEKPTPGTLPLAALADLYLGHLEQAGKGRGTVFSYSIDLALAVKHLGTDTPLRELTERKIANFFESDTVTKTRKGRAKAKPTIDKTRRVLRLALMWAESEGLVEKAPVPEAYQRPRRHKEKVSNSKVTA